jgi:membrane protease YdiL (CAAX protease family)
MKIKPFIRNRSISIYFWLAYLIAWVGSWVAVGPKFLRGEIMQPQQDYWLIGVAMLLAPSSMGIAMTILVDGRIGLQELLRKMKKWRVRSTWYLAPLIFPALILTCLLPLSVLVSPEFRPTFFPLGIIMGLAAGFLEEIGWMGFAFPRMRARTNTFRAAINLGVLHVLWHFAASYLGASGKFGQYWLFDFVAFCFAMVAMRIILVWVYVNTESLFMAQLMHASSSGFLAILVSMSISPANDALFYAVYAVVLWIAVFVIIARYGKNLTVQDPN